MKKKLGITAAVIAVLFLGAVLSLFILVEPDDIKDEVLARARSRTGYALEAGPASFKLGLSGAGIQLDGVWVAAPDSSHTLEAQQVDIFLKILPLIQRRVELAKMVVNRGQYHQTASWGDLRLQNVNLTGALKWSELEGGRGHADGTMAGGTIRGSQGDWAFPESKVRLQFQVSADGDSIGFTEIGVESGPLRGMFSGTYARADAGWGGTLTGAVDRVSWSDLTALLPADRVPRLEAIDIAGVLAVPELQVTTEPGSESRTEGVLTFDEVSLQAHGAPLGLSGVKGSVRFSRDRLTLEPTTGRLGDDTVTVSGRLEGRENRKAKVSVAARLAGPNLARMLPPESSLRLTAGSVDADLTVEGAVPFAAVPAVTGSLRLEGLRGSLRELPLENAKGTVRFLGKGAEVEQLSATWGKSDFALNGTLADLSEPWLRFRMTSSNVDLNEIFPQQESSSADAGATGPVVGVPGSGTVEVGTLRVRKLALTGVTAKARLDLDGLVLEDVHASAYGGRVEGDLAVRPVPGEAFWNYTAKLALADVGIGELLLGWSPAGKVLEGRLNGEMDIEGKAGGGVDPRSLMSLQGALRMKEGAVLNAPGLTALGQALGIKGVADERWPFRSLQTKVQVRDGKVVVDGLQLVQPGFGWTLGGLVGLDGSMSLTGTVRADPQRVTLPAEVSFLAPYLAESDGRIPIDFTLGGALSSPRVGLDWDSLTRRAAEKAKQKEAQELEKKLEETIKDPNTLNKLKKLLGGG